MNPEVPKEHHPWCNKFNIPAGECEMCKRLNTQYPVLENEAEMVEKYFPESRTRE